MAHEHEDNHAYDQKARLGPKEECWAHGESKDQSVLSQHDLKAKSQHHLCEEIEQQELLSAPAALPDAAAHDARRDLVARGQALLQGHAAKQWHSYDGALLDSHGQPLGSNKAPDPRADGFYRVISELKDKHLFIDKTAFLSSYLGGERRFDLIARPLGMGKTVLLKTIAALYSGRSEVLPSHLEVLKTWSEPPKDVIFIDFAQLCNQAPEQIRHSFPTTEELILGPYICGTDLLNRRRSQGLITHMAEYEYQFYQGDNFASKVYDQFYQQCTRSFAASEQQEIHEVSDGERQGNEDFSGILSHTEERSSLLHFIRLLSACKEQSRVLIIDNIDAPLLNALHLPECYNQRASFISRFLLLLSQHGQAFRHILLSAQCLLPEVDWQPQDGITAGVTSDLNSERWQSPEFANYLGFTVAELKAQVPAEICAYIRDYLSLEHSISDDDALWELFAQNFGGYSFDRHQKLLMPRLVMAQLCHPSLSFNPVLTYEHGALLSHETVEAMPDLDFLYLHVVSRLPFETFIGLFALMMRGRYYTRPLDCQLPLTLPSYPDQISGRDKTDFSRPTGKGTASAEEKESKEPKEQEPAQEPKQDLEVYEVGASRTDTPAKSPSAAPEASEANAAAVQAKDTAADAKSGAGESAAAVSAAGKPGRKRRQRGANAEDTTQEAAQDHIGAILGFGDKLEPVSTQPLSHDEKMLQDFMEQLHGNKSPHDSSDQSSSLDYSKLQDALSDLEQVARNSPNPEVDGDQVGYFDSKEGDEQLEKLKMFNRALDEIFTKNKDKLSKLRVLGPGQSGAGLRSELSAKQQKQEMDHNVLQTAFAHMDAKAEGGFPAVNSTDLALLERLSLQALTGPSGVQIEENAAADLVSALARLDLMRKRLAKSRSFRPEQDDTLSFDIADLMRALGFLTFSCERHLPNIDLVPNRYFYRKLRLMALGALFRADCPLNSSSDSVIAQGLASTQRKCLEVEYDFSGALKQVAQLREMFTMSGLGAMFARAQGKRSDDELRLELGELPELTLQPGHFFPVRAQARVYVPLITNIINWLSVPSPIHLSPNAINEAVALFCQLHLSNSEDLALGRDIPSSLKRVADFEQSRAQSMQQFYDEIDAAARAAQAYEAWEQEQDMLKAAPAVTESYKSAPQVHGLFIYDEDTPRDSAFEESSLAKMKGLQHAASGAVVSESSSAAASSVSSFEATASVPASVPAPEAEPTDAVPSDSYAAHFKAMSEQRRDDLVARSHDLSLLDEYVRGVNFSTRPIVDEQKERHELTESLDSGRIDLSQALMNLADSQVRRHHNLTIYTPGSAIVVELAVAQSEAHVKQVTSMALRNLMRVDSPLLAALNKQNPHELETTQVQRILLVCTEHAYRMVVRQVLVVDINHAPAE